MRKKERRVRSGFFILFVLLSIIIIPFLLSPNFVIPVYASIIFSDDFEDGTLDTWTSNTTGTGDVIGVNTTASINGTYGLFCDSLYVYAHFTALSIYYTPLGCHFIRKRCALRRVKSD